MNLQEAIETVCAYFHSTAMEKLVENLINDVLEKSESGRKKIGHLLGQLVNRNILLGKQYESGLRLVLQIAGDLVVDVPKVWIYLGELIGISDVYLIIFITSVFTYCLSHYYSFAPIFGRGSLMWDKEKNCKTCQIFWTKVPLRLSQVAYKI